MCPVGTSKYKIVDNLICKSHRVCDYETMITVEPIMKTQYKC